MPATAATPMDSSGKTEVVTKHKASQGIDADGARIVKERSDLLRRAEADPRSLRKNFGKCNLVQRQAGGRRESARRQQQLLRVKAQSCIWLGNTPRLLLLMLAAWNSRAKLRLGSVEIHRNMLRGTGFQSLPWVLFL